MPDTLRPLAIPPSVNDDAGWETLRPIRRNHSLYLRPLFIGQIGIVDRSDNPIELCATEMLGFPNVLRISRLSNLELLQLNETAISNDGLEHLSSLTNLNWLLLGFTDVGDDGLKHLSGLKNLEWLSLVDTQVTDDGVKMLQESLPNCEIAR